MKKKIILMFILVLTISFFTGCGQKENVKPNIDDNDITSEETELDGNHQKVSLLLSDESSDSIEITFNTDRFGIEEYFFTEPQSTIYFTDKSNGAVYSIFVDSNPGLSTEDYYNKLVYNAEKNVNADDFKATKMEDISYGGINFKKFSVTWSEEYEYTDKDTGKLVSGVSNNEETAIFSELKSGAFLRYEGVNDEEILKNLFVNIKK